MTVSTSETQSPNNASRPLSGIRVVEASSYISGPWAASMLSDLGADVIKIEPKTGDPYRNFGHNKEGLSAVWTTVNRGKKGIALDLKSEEGAAELRELLKTADVFIQNWRPRVAASLGFDAETVKRLNPKLIRVSITGYGSSGPLAAEPAFDALLQGVSGIVASPAKGARPDATPFFVVDKISAVLAAQAILAALYKRAVNGVAEDIDMSMLDATAFFSFPDLFQNRTFVGDESEWRAPPSPVVPTKDGYMVLSPVSGQQLGKTLEVIGRTEWKDDFRKIPDRVEMAHQFFERLGPVLRTRTSAEWLPLFKAADVPCGPVYDPDQHLEDSQVQHNQLYSTLESPKGPVRSVRYPAIFGGAMLRASSPAPELGQHNGEVLTSKANAK